MSNKYKRIMRCNVESLNASGKSFKDIYRIMFSVRDNILCEGNDGFRTYKQSYGEVDGKIRCAASKLYETVGATHDFIALAIDNSPEWIVGFWAILMSGNKPYIVNMRYPKSLTNGILKTLNIKYVISAEDLSLDAERIAISSLKGDGAVPSDVFEDEIAFSSSATSMNEVICFYNGFQVAEQILNLCDVTSRDKASLKCYKGELKHLAFLPFYHVFGLFAVYFWGAFFGSTFVFLKDYSGDTIMKTCRKHSVTHIFAVPVLWHTVEKSVISSAKEKGEKQYKKLMNAVRFNTAFQNVFPSFGTAVAKRITKSVCDRLFGKSLIFCISGGSYVRDSALSLINGLGYSLRNGYGMSEVGITSVDMRKSPKQRNENSIGKPFKTVEYRISEDGVLQIKSTFLCTRKLVNGVEQKTGEWFDTGDNMHETDGNYFIYGRVSEMVIGDNGENINPDTVEKMFDIRSVKALSVLGLKGDDQNDELSIVIQISPYIGEDALNSLKNEVYAINDTLPHATAIKKFYFTVDELSPPNSIKVSRTGVKNKIADGRINLVAFADMKTAKGEDKDSPLMGEVIGIIAKVLDTESEKIETTSHIFYDLGATSIQYFSILTKISETFSIGDFGKSENYCYTPKDLCEFIERHI